MTDLKLLALDSEDLEVISATTQDAVIRVRDMGYARGDKRFALLMNRYAWEVDGGRSKGQVTDWTVSVLEPSQMRHAKQGNQAALPRIIKTNSIAILPHRAFNKMARTQRLADGAQILVLAFELKRRRAPGNA